MMHSDYFGHISSAYEGNPFHEFLSEWERIKILAKENPAIKHHFDELKTALKLVTGEDW